MPKFDANGVQLYFEEHGKGFPLIWSHEFGGNYDSWDPQVNFFSRRYRVITYAARGYPPSDVPEDPAAYSQDQAIEDLRLLMVHLNIPQAHIGGLSMGGNVALNFGLRHPAMARSLIVAACGSGSDDPDQFRSDGSRMTEVLMTQGMDPMARDYGHGPTRTQLLRKDPKGFQVFYDGLASHSALGSALTYRGIQMTRPPIYDLAEGMRQLHVPTLVMIGDEDGPCVNPAVFIEAEHSPLWAGRLPPQRTRHQPRGAGPLQPHRPRLPVGSGRRRLAAPLDSALSNYLKCIFPLDGGRLGWG